MDSGEESLGSNKSEKGKGVAPSWTPGTGGEQKTGGSRDPKEWNKDFRKRNHGRGLQNCSEQIEDREEVAGGTSGCRDH